MMNRRGFGTALLVAAAVLCAMPPARAAPAPFAGPAVDAERLAVTSAGGALQVYDEIALANTQPSALRTLRLPLPAGARRVRLVSGFAGGPSVAASDPVAPVRVPPHGHATLVFTYVLPGRPPVPIARRIALPTARFAVLVRQGQLAVRSADLADVGVQTLNGIRVHAYAAEGLPPGQVVRLTVITPPTPLGRLAALFTPAVWMAAAAAALAGLFALGLRRLPPAEAGAAEAPAPTEARGP